MIIIVYLWCHWLFRHKHKVNQGFKKCVMATARSYADVLKTLMIVLLDVSYVKANQGTPWCVIKEYFARHIFYCVFLSGHETNDFSFS